MSQIEYTASEAVARIVFNRPERKNSFTLEMFEEFGDFICRAQRDPSVRVLLVTGAGDSFCSGVDLDAFFGRSDPRPYDNKSLLTERVHSVAHALDRCDKPVVAAVRGAAVGAGMDMSLMADIRLASTTARFSERYIKVGLLPGDGGCYLLPRIVGRARALELMWTGEFVDAASALAYGMVNHVFDDEEFEDSAWQYAKRLAESPPLLTRLIKRATIDGEDMSFRAALDLISSHQAVVQSTHDSAEALAATTERRAPVFRGC
jgi:enoyl-CoA hydratase/carnithine racemase